MTQIIQECRQAGIPLVATFELDLQPDHEENDPLLCSTILMNGKEFKPTSPKMDKAARILKPDPVYTAAVVESTTPDGKKTVKIYPIS